MSGAPTAMAGNPTAMAGNPAPPVGTFPPLPPARCPVTVAPFVGTRVSGLSPADLDPLAPPGLADANAVVVAAAERVGKLADDLADALYRVIPTLPTAARRLAIRVRRDVHNGRSDAGRRRLFADLADALPDGPRRAALDWAEASTRLAAAEDAAARVAADAVATGATWMLDRLRAEPVLSGLALASPLFAAELIGDGTADAGRLGGRVSRSAISYLSRAAVKVSPFSTLGLVGLAWLAAPADHTVPTMDLTRPDREPVPPTSLAVALLYALATSERTAARFSVVGNPSVRQSAAGARALLPIRMCRNGFFFREDEPTDIVLYAGLLDRLPATPTPLGEWARDAHELALGRRLVDVGLLLPVPPWRAGTGPFDALVELASAVPETDVTEPARALAGAAAAMSGGAAGRERITLDRRARAAARAMFAALDVAPPPWLPDAPLFHENVAFTGAPPPDLPGGALCEDLAEYARHVAPAVSRSASYERTVAAFVARFGAGGTCPDLLEFLCDQAIGADPAAMMWQPGRLRRPEAPRGHGTLARPAYSLVFQLAASDVDTLRRGGYRLVVGALNQGPGALLGRWAGVPALRDGLTDAMRHWWDVLYPGCAVYQVTAGADWASVQRPALDLPRLRWPSDLPGDGPDGLGLDRFRLVHDPATDTLQALDDRDRPSAFAYTGVVPHHMVSGVLRLLLELTDPWVTATRVDNDRRPFDPPPQPVTELSFRPRHQVGRIVYGRARWTVPPGELPVPERDEEPARFLRRLDLWRREHGIPDEVYCRFPQPSGAFSRQKPAWVAFGNPHAVWSMCRSLPADAAAVELTEALPARHEHWYTDRSGRPRALELMALVRVG